MIESILSKFLIVENVKNRTQAMMGKIEDKRGQKLSLRKGNYSASILLKPRPQQWARERCNAKIVPKIWNSVTNSLNNLFYFFIYFVYCVSMHSHVRTHRFVHAVVHMWRSENILELFSLPTMLRQGLSCLVFWYTP